MRTVHSLLDILRSPKTRILNNKSFTKDAPRSPLRFYNCHCRSLPQPSIAIARITFSHIDRKAWSNWLTFSKRSWNTMVKLCTYIHIYGASASADPASSKCRPMQHVWFNRSPYYSFTKKKHTFVSLRNWSSCSMQMSPLEQVPAILILSYLERASTSYSQ